MSTFRARVALLSLWLVALSVWLYLSAQPRSQTLTPPNILLIVVDDLGVGDPLPSIPQLGAEGVTMMSAYAGANWCCPSRASLLTGQYGASANVGIPHLLPPGTTEGIPPAVTTIAEALAPVGYRRCAIGKWHVGELDQFLPPNQGFDCSLVWPGSAGQPGEPIVKRDGVLVEPGYTREALHDLWTQEAIAQTTPGGTPSFVYLAYTLMHVPVLEQTPMRFRSGATDTPTIYRDALTAVASSLDALRAHLASTGQADNTLVILTSDNGAQKNAGGSNAPLKGNKGSLWEGALRVPLVARWPGVIPAGTTHAAQVINHDVFQTVLDTAGASRPAETVGFGESLLPLWRNNTPLPARPLYWFRQSDIAVMREGKWKAVQHQAGWPFALYNLEIDPKEQTNRAANQSARVQAMIASMRSFAQSIGASGPVLKPKKR